MIKGLNQLSKEIHENAKEHGWWDDERSFGEIIALCHSELSEALEEYRNKNGYTFVYCGCGDIFQCNCRGCSDYEKCEGKKPEGIPVELADCIIRILDYLGKQKIDIESKDLNAIVINHYYVNFAEFITSCHAYLTRAYERKDFIFEYLKGLIYFICIFCENEKIDIDKIIRIKHEYNKTRAYKHGGKII